jgi:hypothetical protein
MGSINTSEAAMTTANFPRNAHEKSRRKTGRQSGKIRNAPPGVGTRLPPLARGEVPELEQIAGEVEVLVGVIALTHALDGQPERLGGQARHAVILCTKSTR